MGSVRMAVDKILAVFLAVAGQCAWTVPQFSTTTSTTPVPILRYVDTQNTDGSYTFGFEGADGTYKLETRYSDGRVKGKYGYFDPEGVFREATYGAEAGRGFEPNIKGVKVPPPTIVYQNKNEIPQIFEPDTTGPQKFKHFQTKSDSQKGYEGAKTKQVKGKRTLLKKRLKAKETPAPADVVSTGVQRENNLRAREEHMKSLLDHRQQLLNLQRTKEGARQSYDKDITSSRQPGQGQGHPFVSRLDINSGS